MESSSYEDCKKYVLQERSFLEPVLDGLGYTLDKVQPHLSGERFLMHAVTTTSGKKLILLGTHNATGARVVVKATRDANGKDELAYERACRTAIHRLTFTYHAFASPAELFFGERSGFCISIQEYIEQSSTFLTRPLAQQFAFVLTAFKAQEGAHAATYEQLRAAKQVFGSIDTDMYLKNAQEFGARASSIQPGLSAIYQQAYRILEKCRIRIEQYGNFLTHTDFVPHNFRIKGDVLYLLDYSSLRFGNKHEGWARMLNFMTLYNPELERAFLAYFKENRAIEENESLHVMRIYRLTEIIWYYVRATGQSSGNLRLLNDERIQFWSQVLAAQLEGNVLNPAIRLEYMGTRDALRSDEERERQKNLH